LAPNPLHALALLPAYFKWTKAVDPLALVTSSTFVDIEVIYTFESGAAVPHGPWHSFFMAMTAYPMLIALLTFALERGIPGRVSALYKLLRWDSSRFRYPLKTIFICAFLGSFSHIFTDMWIHPVSGYIRWPFIVLENNPVYLGQWGIAVNIAMVVLSAYALILWHQSARKKAK